MKKRSKIFSVAIALLLLCVCIAGCSPFGFQNPFSSPSSSAASPSLPSASAPASQSQKTAYTRGSWTDGVYKNEYFGFQLKVPEGWAADTDEELATRMNVTVDKITSGSNLDATNNVSYEFFTYDKSTNSNLGCNVEKLPYKLSEAQYMQIVEPQLEQIVGMDVESKGNKPVTIGGQEWKCYTYFIPDVKAYQSFYLLSKDGYIAIMTLTCMEANQQDGEVIIGSISALS